jgi:hypothetical protein
MRRRQGKALLATICATFILLAADSGEAFVRSLEYAEIVLLPGELSKSSNLTRSQNANNCVPFATSMGNSGAGGFGRMFTDVYVTAGSPPTVTVERGVADTGTVTVGIYIVEFQPADVRVQRGTYSLATGSTGPATGTLSPSVDTARAALLFYGKNNVTGTNQGYDRVMVEGRTNVAGTQVEFRRDTGTSTTIDGHWYVFEALNNSGYKFSVQPRTFTFTSVTGTSTALSPAVSPSLSFVVGSYLVAATNRDPDEAHLRLYMNCAATCTSISASSDAGGASITVTAYAITFASGVSVQRGTFNYATSSNQETAPLIPPLDPGKTMAWSGFGYAAGIMQVEGNGVADVPQGQQKVIAVTGTSVRGNRAMTGALAVGPWEAIQWSSITAVTLTSFEAVGVPGAVELSWETGSEIDNLGFHVYRASHEDGPYERITKAVIPGLGSSPSGARYTYVDDGVPAGETRHYKLEDIETTGATKLHGPVSAAPLERAASENNRTEPVTAGIAYGLPGATLRLLDQSRTGVTVELETSGFYAEPQEGGTVRLRIPEFSEESLLPVRRTWIQAVSGRSVRIVSVEASRVESFEGLRPGGGQEAKLVASRDGIVRVARGRGRAVPSRANASSEWAHLAETGFQGDVKKALLEISPLRFDESKGALLLARRIVVRISFEGRERDDLRTSASHRRARKENSVVARVATTERGLHAVRFEDLFRGGRRLRVDGLRLSRQGPMGTPVAFHVEPEGPWFGPGSELFFWSDGARANPYGREAVFEMELAPGASGGRPMATARAGVSGASLASYGERIEREENRLYQAALVDETELWFWDFLIAPASKSYSFDVSALAAVFETAKLAVRVQSVSDAEHRVRLFVNGSFVEERSWYGRRSQLLEAELSAGLLRDGTNTLTIESEAGAGYSGVMLDRFRVDYPRLPIATQGRLEGTFGASGMVEISGLGAGTVLLDRTDPDPRWLYTAPTADGGTFRFRAESGRQYVAVSADAVLRPAVRKTGSTGLRAASRSADYLVIGPEEFLEAARPLLDFRRGQGLDVEAVPLEAIAAEFGFGESSPDAIRAFVAHVYHEWREPRLRYVMLLGDATYDFKDYLQTGVVNHVPPLMVRTSFLWTASDPGYGTVHGTDPLPDVAVGRLPAASVDEVRALVSKVLAYERGERPLDGKVVLVTDDADEAGDFELDADEIASSLAGSHEVEKIYLSELGAGVSRRAVLDAFDGGASLMSYVGHGGIHLWASEGILTTSDLGSLERQERQPILLTMNCLNGYFHFPYFDSLSEALLKLEDRGAIAAFSPSGMSFNEPAHRFHQALVGAILGGRHARLGDAVLAAQMEYAETGAFPELLTIYHLLGDPALSLAR